MVQNGNGKHNSVRTNVLFALPEEATPFLKRLTSVETCQDSERNNGIVPDALDKAAFGSMELRVNHSGAGALNAAAATKRMLSRSKQHVLLICGFAGGLVDGLTPGTLVIGDSVTDHSGMMLTADSRLLAIAESVRLPELAAMRGTIYTADKVLTQSVEKQALAKAKDVIAVDMETFAAAEVAQEAGVPWLAVRVVTDGSADDMPFDFNAMTGAGGNVNKGRVIVSALTHPQTIPALIRLGARSSLAAKNLALFLQAYLQALPDVNT